MGYAVRPLRRTRVSTKPRSVRHRSRWVPGGGSAQYMVTDSLPTIEIGNTSVILFSDGATSGGGLRPLRYTSPVRAF